MDSRYYDTYEDNGLTTTEKIQYSLLGIIVLGGAVILGRSMVKKQQAAIEEKKSFDDGSHAAIAKQIKMSFENDGWWGTDEDTLRYALRRVTSKEDFKKVMSSYERLYNSSLLRDMKDELSSSEYAEMIAIINAKPDRPAGNPQTQPGTLHYQSWARRLNAAFNLSYGFIPATDEEAIRTVFLEIPTQSAFLQVAEAYQSEFGTDLITDLKSELEFWEYEPMLDIISRKPKV
ncbi:MAG TPA: hypothetical protein VEB40_14470 [Flavipsychrobacter sp.]|nr:hypothetical protein [Flavipsychrobacter sp.]